MAFLDSISPSVQDIPHSFELRSLMPRLCRADALGTLVQKLTTPDINLSPVPGQILGVWLRGGILGIG